MYKNILTYVDMHNTTSWKKSLPKAVELAEKFDAELNIITTIPDFGMPIVEQFFPDNFDEEKVKNAILAQLEDFIEKNVKKGVKTRAIISKREPHHSILRTCEKVDIDLIVIPAILKKNHLYNFGTTATSITRYAKCSVLIIK
jgi:nucleotide-binding universal stress UspA family protein